MPQSADKVLDHGPLFREPEYEAMLENKRVKFECGHPDEMIREIGDWSKSWEYREKNLARTAATINPAKACQPLGAVFAGAGYEKTMSFVHGRTHVSMISTKTNAMIQAGNLV